MLVAAAAKTWNVPAAELTTAEQHGAACGQQPQRDVRRARRSRRDAAGAGRRQRHAEAEAELPLARHARHGRRQREARARRAAVRHRSARPGHAVRHVRESAGDRRARRGGESRCTSARCRGVKNAFIVAHQGDPIGFNPAARRRAVGRRDRRRLDLERAAGEEGARGAVGRERKRRATAGRAPSRKRSRSRRSPPRKCSARPATSKPRSRAGKTVEAFYTYHYVSHADLEPQNCTAWFKGDSIEIWAPTQTPQNAVDAVAALLGLPKEKVTLHQLRGGGGFGRRLANDSVCEAALISKQAGGIPVKVQWTREDDMAFDYYRPGGFHALKAAVDKRRQALGVAEPLHHVQHGRQGAGLRRRRSTRPSSRRTCSANQRMLQSMIPSKIPTGPWRAPGSNVIAFCVQGFLHECAVAANRDYVDFLVELMGEPRATSARIRSAARSTRAAPSNVIKAVAETVGLGQRRCRPAAGSGSRSTSATRGTSPRSPTSASTRARRSRCTRSGSSPTSARS